MRDDEKKFLLHVIEKEGPEFYSKTETSED